MSVAVEQYRFGLEDWDVWTRRARRGRVTTLAVGVLPSLVLRPEPGLRRNSRGVGRGVV